MKNINNLLRLGGLALFLIISIQSGMAQTRNVSWLHGLGENNTTWDDMELIFRNERTMITDATDISGFFTSDEGIAVAQAEADILSDPNGIVIGHSTGGIVARAIDLDPTDARDFGGIISVGTPNSGAAISNSITNGDVDRAMTSACNSVLAGPTSVIPGVNIVIQAITPPIICEILSDNIVEPLLGEQNNQTGQDLAVGSNVINGMSGGTSGIPQISIWGNERSPVHWRLLSSLDTDNANDTRWVNRAEDFRSVYNGFFIAHTSAAVASGIGGFFVPGLWAVAAKQAFSAVQWKRGVRWFDNSESHWNQLIDCGNDRTQTIVLSVQTIYLPDQQCSCTEEIPAEAGCWEHWEMICAENPDACWTTIEVTETVFVNGASDGFICEDSQIGPVAIDVYEARDANHSEEVVHIEVQRQLRACFDRDDFFDTE